MTLSLPPDFSPFDVVYRIVSPAEALLIRRAGGLVVSNEPVQRNRRQTRIFTPEALPFFLQHRDAFVMPGRPGYLVSMPVRRAWRVDWPMGAFNGYDVPSLAPAKSGSFVKVPEINRFMTHSPFVTRLR